MRTNSVFNIDYLRQQFQKQKDILKKSSLTAALDPSPNQMQHTHFDKLIEDSSNGNQRRHQSVK